LKSLNKEIQKMSDIDYLKYCISLTPEERLRLGFELSEWAIKTNKHIDIVMQERLKGSYLLR
jgi:hypothetical protein